MRESVKSLRAYLLIVAAWIAFKNYEGLTASNQPALLQAAVYLSMVVALAYAYCGFMLPSLLVRAPGQALAIIAAGGAFTAAAGLGIYFYVASIPGAASVSGVALLSPLGAVIITIYLYRNVKRLADEAKGPAPIFD